jgi:tetratricopeptide (TPR) repeat protein
VAPLAPVAPAIDISGPLSEQDTEFVEEHLAEGRVFRKYGLVDKAADQFEAVVARFPDNVDVRLELKDIHKERGASAKAAEQCLALAQIFRLKGDPGQAEAHEAEARELVPGAAPAKAAPPAPQPVPPAPKPVPPAVKPAAPAGKPAVAAVRPAPKPAPPPPEPEDVEEEIALPEEEIALEVEEGGLEAEALGELPNELPSLDLGDEGGEELPPHFVEEDLPSQAPDVPLVLEDEEAALPTAAAEFEAPSAEAEMPGLELEDLALDEPAPPPPPPRRAPAPPPPAPRRAAAPPPPAPAPLRAPAPKAAPAAAAPAAGPPPDLRKVLDEVDSYISLGFVDDAREALKEIGAKYPSHPAILDKIERLGLDREVQEPVPEEDLGLGELEPPPVVAEASPFEQELVEQAPEPAPEDDLGLDGLEPPSIAEEPSPFEQELGDLRLPASEPEPAFEAEAAFDLEPPAEDFLPSAPSAAEPESLLAGLESPDGLGGLDLGAELGDLFGAQAAVEESTLETVSAQLGDSGLAEIFKEFKRGVDQQLGKEDYDTRYNLGIAYKEMGLIDEAIAEFQLAAKDVGRLLECTSMLGICFLEKGMPKLAVKWFEKGLKAPGRTDEEYQGLRYDLALAHEASGDRDQALNLYSEIYGQNANFRDVAAKVQELRAALG